MVTINVQTKQGYRVLVGANLLSEAGDYIQKIKSCCKIAIISDTNVWPLYGNILSDSLSTAAYESVHYVFQAGEESKNTETYFKILNFLAENKISRTDLIVALGGGVVGDIAGFAAATYLRGISYIQIPTSLLAMVDSSVGGKTAIDLPAGKNLVGAFKQPSLVICDTSVLSTLPVKEFSDGCAEVIKYGMLYDLKLIQYLLNNGPDFDREQVIAKCISFKRDVIQEDEFDTGIRQKLNFGHTIGHSIESISNYQITHGQAVAIGMAVITKSAVARGFCPEHVYEILDALLIKFDLPVCTEFTAAQLFQHAILDKKRNGSSVNLILPRNIGDCVILTLPVNELKSLIEAGL